MNDQAIESFNAALRANPATGGTGTNEDVINHCRRALELTPRLWNAALLLGAALRRNGRFGDATDAYREAIAHHRLGEDEDSPRISLVLELATCLIARGEPAAGLEVLEEEASITDTMKGAIVRAEAHLVLGRATTACAALREYEGATEGDLSELLLVKARALLMTGNRAGARDALLGVFRREPEARGLEPLLRDVGLRIERVGEQLQLFETGPSPTCSPFGGSSPCIVDQQTGQIGFARLPPSGRVIGLGVALSVAGGLLALVIRRPLFDLLTFISLPRDWQVIWQTAPWAFAYALAGMGGRLLTRRRAVVLGAFTGVVWMVGSLLRLAAGDFIPLLIGWIATFSWAGCAGGIAHSDRRRAIGGAIGGGIGGAAMWFYSVLFGVSNIVYSNFGNLVGVVVSGVVTGTLMWLGIALGESIATRNRR